VSGEIWRLLDVAEKRALSREERLAEVEEDNRQLRRALLVAEADGSRLRRILETMLRASSIRATWRRDQ